MTSATAGGRPRNTAIDEAVRSAARALLAEVGYDQVTMDATAARAGTSKPAIYRRYRSKAEMLFAAAVHNDEPDAPEDTGTLRGDLEALATRIHADMSSSAAGEVAPRMLAEIAGSPETAQRFRERFVAGERAEVEAVLDRAVERGELAQRPDIATVHRLLGGALFFALFVATEPVNDDDLAALTGVVASGLASADERAAG